MTVPELVAFLKALAGTARRGGMKELAARIMGNARDLARERR